MTIDIDPLEALVARVLQSPNTGVKAARASLQAKANYLRGAIDSCEARAEGAEGPIPDACRMLVHAYREALVPLNHALLALSTEGEQADG